MDPHRYIVLCSNEPAISEQIVVGSLDKATGLLTFRSQEGEALRAALQDYFIAGAIFDLNYSDDSILETIGQTQRACRHQPLICISGRQLTGHTLSQPNRTFYYAHPQIPPFALRKMLQQPPLAEPMCFQGPLQARCLAEMVQLLLFAGLSGCLKVWNELKRGDLWVHRAQIVHADAGGRQGHAAALAMLSWPSGTFRFQPGRAPTQTMQLGPHYPLFDKMRSHVGAAGNSVSSADSPTSSSEDSPRNLGIPMLDRVAQGIAPLESALSHRSPAVPMNASVISQRSPLLGEMQPVALASSSAFEGTAPVSAPLDAKRVLPSRKSAPVEPSGESTPITVPFEEPGLKEITTHSWQQMDAADNPEPTRQENIMAITANSVKEVLSKLELTVEGFIGAAVADSDSGMCIGTTGGGGLMNMEVAAAANTEVVRAKRKAMKTLNLRDEIEDILITLGKHYHLIRPLRARPQIFIYVAVDRTRANLAMARFSLADIERDLGV